MSQKSANECSSMLGSNTSQQGGFGSFGPFLDDLAHVAHIRSK